MEQTAPGLLGEAAFDRFGALLALNADGTILAVGAVRSGPTFFDNQGYV